MTGVKQSQLLVLRLSLEFDNNDNPTEQVLSFKKLLNEKLDIIFPQKCLKINPNIDLPYFTCELKNWIDKLKESTESMQNLRSISD